MSRRIIECVANFSEGRDPAVVATIAETIAGVPNVAVLGQTMDADHHRSVITFAGPPANVAEAAFRSVREAVRLIDLTRHDGVHPRIGAADVIPFVPVENVTLDQCAKVAAITGQRIWRELKVPVYLYEAAAMRSDRILLENIRRGGFEALRDEIRVNPERKPDFGCAALHPTAGATVIGARKFLIAWNVLLDTPDVMVAKRIAKAIRASSGGFPHVKALGLMIESRNLAQVSMNLTGYEITPMHIVYEAIRLLAAQEGTGIHSSEIIGFLPRAAVEQAAASYLKCENLSNDVVLENRLQRALPDNNLGALLDRMASPSNSTGGGSAAAISAGMAASLASLVCRLCKLDDTRFREYRRFFEAAQEEDAEAFAALMRNPTPHPEAVYHAAEVPLAIAERALLMSADIYGVSNKTPDEYRSDIETAQSLGHAAVAGGVHAVRQNLDRAPAGSKREELKIRFQKIINAVMPPDVYS